MDLVHLVQFHHLRQPGDAGYGEKLHTHDSHPKECQRDGNIPDWQRPIGSDQHNYQRGQSKRNTERYENNQLSFLGHDLSVSISMNGFAPD